LGARRSYRPGHRAADSDLHLGGFAGTRLRRPHLGGDPGADRLSGHHECRGHLPAAEARTEMVASSMTAQSSCLQTAAGQQGTHPMSEVTAAPSPGTPPAPARERVTARDVNVYYGGKQALKNVSIDIFRNEVVAFIGPSGCGKSTFLRCINRMNDVIENCQVSGEILLDGHDIYARDIDVVQLRARVGMVFQKPNPFPKSIYDNVAYG